LQKYGTFAEFFYYSYKIGSTMPTGFEEIHALKELLFE